MTSAARAAADLAHCRALLHAGSKSFALAGRLLPRAHWADVVALYAFCRVADDLIDHSDAPRAAHTALVLRLGAIARAAATPPGEPAGPESLGGPVDRSLARTMQRTGLPVAPIEALLEGFLWDAQGRDYPALADTLDYAARVAGSVGVCMAWLMGVRSPTLLARAADLGIAMQLTNIARDVGEDARLGRIYVPGTWLAQQGLAPHALLALARPPATGPEPAVPPAAIGPSAPPTAPAPAVQAVVARLLAEADALYARGCAGIGGLPWRCRLAIGAAARIYRDIGRSIRRQGCDTLHRRAVVSLGRKLWLVACTLVRPLGPPAPPQARLAPPLPAATFLLQPLLRAAAPEMARAHASA